jgi:hypothetical protein
MATLHSKAKRAPGNATKKPSLGHLALGGEQSSLFLKLEGFQVTIALREMIVGDEDRQAFVGRRSVVQPMYHEINTPSEWPQCR